MASDRNHADVPLGGPESEMNDEPTPGVGDDIRGVADEGDEDFEELDETEEDEDEEAI